MGQSQAKSPYSLNVSCLSVIFSPNGAADRGRLTHLQQWNWSKSPAWQIYHKLTRGKAPFYDVIYLTPARRLELSLLCSGVGSIWVSTAFFQWPLTYNSWQATQCPSPASCNVGSCRAHISLRSGQRVWKEHPEGGFMGLGTSPCKRIFFFWTSGSGIGTAESKAWL